MYVHTIDNGCVLGHRGIALICYINDTNCCISHNGHYGKDTSFYYCQHLSSINNRFYVLQGSEETCMTYFKDTLVMFMGGIMVALAVEYSGLHKRLALRVIQMVGCSPRRFAPL